MYNEDLIISVFVVMCFIFTFTSVLTHRLNLVLISFLKQTGEMGTNETLPRPSVKCRTSGSRKRKQINKALYIKEINDKEINLHLTAHTDSSTQTRSFHSEATENKTSVSVPQMFSSF